MELTKFSMDEMIANFNREVSCMDLFAADKIKILGMITAIGFRYKEDVQFVHAIPTAQPEPCEYCHEDSDGYVKPIEKNNHAFVRFGMDGWELDLKANGWHGSAKIMYCPMCGRGLKHG